MNTAARKMGAYSLTSTSRAGERDIVMALTKEIQPKAESDYITIRVSAEEACKDQQFAHAIKQCSDADNHILVGPIELDEEDVARWHRAYEEGK